VNIAQARAPAQRFRVGVYTEPTSQATLHVVKIDVLLDALLDALMRVEASAHE